MNVNLILVLHESNKRNLYLSECISSTLLKVLNVELFTVRSNARSVDKELKRMEEF